MKFTMEEFTIEAVIDTSEGVLSRLESREEVAYAEVGGVVRRATDAVVTAEGVRSATDHDESGVWWRAFAGGAADYRYTTSFDDDHLDDFVERSVRSGTVLGQETPASYDRGTVHRAIHPGWAAPSDETADDGGSREPSLAGIDADEKAERVWSAFADAVADLAVERTRADYRDEQVESVLLDTNGSAVNTTLERASVEPTVVPKAGPKLRDHFGSTTGPAFLDSLPERLSAFAGRGDVRSDLPEATLDSDERRSVVFGQRAAGELFHHLLHYLEVDSVYFGSSPYDLGDRLGPEGLTVEDAVRAGSWAARAYDAEGRPTQPATLVSDGVVTNYLYDTAAAIEEEAFPAGNVVPSLGFDQPPRVHARHLHVEAGTAAESDLRAGADAAVERVEPPRIVNEATRTKRTSAMPPSVLYAKDVEEMTPSEYDAEPTDQRLRFPVATGSLLEDGRRTARLADATVELALDDFEAMTALGRRTETVTGTCTKHKSTLPYAVTAPAVRLPARVLAE